MKKMIFLSITLLLLFSHISKVSAFEMYSEEELKQMGGIDNIILNNALETKKTDKFMKYFKDYDYNNNYKFKYLNYDNLNIVSYNVLNLNSGYEWVTDVRSGFFINYPIQEQEKSYYCGPVSVKTTLEIINGGSLSQTVYAESMGTNFENGTIVYKIANELNKRQSVNSYGYRQIDSKKDDINRLYQPVMTDLNVNHVPVIAKVDTAQLFMYNQRSLGHYVTLVGYYGMQTEGLTPSFIYADNYNSNYGRGNTFGEHTDSVENFFKSTSYLIW